MVDDCRGVNARLRRSIRWAEMRTRNAWPRISEAVVGASIVERCDGTKSWHVHILSPSSFSSLAVVVRRQFGDQEREFLSNVNTDKELLVDIRVAVCVGENYFNNFARSAERR